jgi:peptidoglycan hydrolase CwlO-like protein
VTALETQNKNFLTQQNGKIKETLEMQKRLREAVEKQEGLVKEYEQAVS